MSEQEGQDRSTQSGTSELDYQEFERVYNVFMNNHQAILDEMTDVLDKYLDNGQYRVMGVVFQPPNPPGCLPYLKIVVANGRLAFEAGVSCVD
jgi:hypothetical protein